MSRRSRKGTGATEGYDNFSRTQAMIARKRHERLGAVLANTDMFLAFTRAFCTPVEPYSEFVEHVDRAPRVFCCSKKSTERPCPEGTHTLCTRRLSPIIARLRRPWEIEPYRNREHQQRLFSVICHAEGHDAALTLRDAPDDAVLLVEGAFNVWQSPHPHVRSIILDHVFIHATTVRVLPGGRDDIVGHLTTGIINHARSRRPIYNNSGAISDQPFTPIPGKPSKPFRPFASRKQRPIYIQPQSEWVTLAQLDEVE